MFKPIPDKDGFSEGQVSALSGELDQGKEKDALQGDVEAAPVDYSGVIYQANRIFGYGMWDRRIDDHNLVHECVSEEEGGGPMHLFIFTVKVQIIVQPQSDCESSIREAIGVGCCSHSNSGRALEVAVKKAEVDGTIKALESYGVQFGLGAAPDLSMSEDSEKESLTEGRAVDGGFFVSGSKAG